MCTNNNLAAVHLATKDYGAAVLACQDTLALEPNNVKVAGTSSPPPSLSPIQTLCKPKVCLPCSLILNSSNALPAVLQTCCMQHVKVSLQLSFLAHP